MIARIQQAGRGRPYRSTRTEQVIDKDGEVQTLEEVTEGEEYCWQANAWYLERKFGQRWGAKRLDVMEALQVLADAKMIPDDIPQLALEEMERVRQTLKQAFEAILVE